MPTPDQIQAAIGVAPNLDAGTAVSAGVASTNNQQAVQYAAATANVGNTTNLVDGLRKAPISQQLSYWNGANHAEQGRLVSLGYSPPPDPATAHPTGFWGHVLGDVTKDASSALSFVGQVGKSLAKEPLTVLGVPLRAIQHTIRAGHVNSEDAMLQSGESISQVANQARGAGAGGGWASFGLMFSPSEWARDWRETSNGEQTFDPAIEAAIQKTMNPSTFKVAKAIASGDSEQSLVSSTPAAQRQALVTQIQSPEVKSAVQQLNAAHMSVGREAVGQKFIVDHPTQGKLLSGGIDAAYDVAADPTMKIGGIADAYRLGIKGVTAADAAEHLDELGRLNPEIAAERHLETVTSPEGGDPIPVTGQPLGGRGPEMW